MLNIRKSRFPALVAGTLATFMCVASIQSSPVLAAGELRQKELYTVGNTSYENNAATHKGNSHDCQHLGIWIPKGTTIRIRQVNTNFDQALTFKLRNDDGQTEVVVNIPKNGDWVEATALADSVPLITSLYSGNGEKPVVEYSVDNAKELPVYHYGDDEQAFFQKWDELDAPFAMYIGEKYSIWLVPARDKGNNQMGSLDDLLLWYDNMVAQYNAFSGLSVDAPDVWNRDSGTRYFVKANRHGVGAAYYSYVETAPNNESLASYMVSTNWGPLHEVGHGYDTVNFASPEIWNNVLSHYYQVATLGAGNWLHLDNDWRKIFEDDRAENGYFGTERFDTRLYFWVNMLDKLGPMETSAYAYQLYRYNAYHGIENLGGHTFYANAYTKGSGYNVTPWFDLWGFTVEDDVREELIESELYQNIYSLINLVPTLEEAETIRNALNLESAYSMVETQEMVRYNQTAVQKVEGTLTIKLDALAAESLHGQTIRITDGQNTVKELTVTGQNLSATLPVGVYNILVPAPASEQSIVLDGRIGYAVVEKNKTATHTVTAKKLTSSTDFIDWTINLGSNFSYWGTFCTATTDISNNSMRIVTQNASPHTYFHENTFSSIKVYNASGNEVYSKICPGEGTTASDNTIHIEPGYTIEVYHAESARGLSVQSSAVNSVKLIENDQFGGTITATFEVTSYGLKMLSPSASSGEDNYYNVLVAKMEQLKAAHPQADFQNPAKLPSEKVKLNLSIKKLPSNLLTQFKNNYTGYYPFDQGVQSLTIAPIPDQNHTGSAVEPALTVTVGGHTLSQAEYQAQWMSNVDVGMARVKVYGLGNYGSYVGEAVFYIRLPDSLPSSFTVTSDVASYKFSNGAKYPSATVKLGNRTLTRGVDYELWYSDNVNVGTATITATGLGNYAGISGSGTFQIVPDIFTLTVTPANSKINYSGEPVTTDVTVYAGKLKLKKDTDYTVSFSNNINVGTAKIHITGIGNYTGSNCEGSFAITTPITPTPVDATEFANWTYTLYSWWSPYTIMNFDLSNSQVIIEHRAVIPNSNFGSSPHGSISIYDSDGSLTYEKKYLGDQDGSAPTDTIPLGLGYIVELYVAEPERNETWAVSNSASSVKMRPKTGKYLVTARGLEAINDDSITCPSSKFPEVIYAYLDKLKQSHAQADFWDSTKFPTEKAIVEKAVAQLTATELQTLKNNYAGYYPFTTPSTDNSGNSGSGSGSGSGSSGSGSSGSGSGSSGSSGGSGSSGSGSGSSGSGSSGSGNSGSGSSSSGSSSKPSSSGGSSSSKPSSSKKDDASSTTPLPEVPAIPPVSSVEFTDVPREAYYYEPVQWAVERGITTGKDTNTFCPEESCTRAQMVTFLWRVAGCPQPTMSHTKFLDIDPTFYYRDAILWAVENGITTGKTPDAFAPDELVTRGEAVTFLHRARGSISHSVEKPRFTDVDRTFFYTNAIDWAAGVGIVKGTSTDRFSPDDPCTRGQIITILFRSENLAKAK